MIQAFKTQCDGEMRAWLSEKKEAVRASLQDTPFGLLFAGVEDLVLAPGKRVRPYIASLGYAGISREAILDWKPFIALELFHVFGLIHDDIIDRGAMRRGIDTLHTQVTDLYRAEGRLGEIEHLGDAQALLMGDLVHMWCHELFDMSSYIRERLDRAKAFFRAMSRDVMLGQMIDVDIMSSEVCTRARLFQKMQLKTASYTFVYPMQIGAALAGETDETVFEQMHAFGTALGIAFQIQDDLMDIYGDVGKSPLRDIADGQHTLLTQYIFASGTDEEKQLLSSLFRTELTAEQQDMIRDLFMSSGARAAAEVEISEQLSRAREILEEMDIHVDVKKDILALVEYLEEREV